MTTSKAVSREVKLTTLREEVDRAVLDVKDAEYDVLWDVRRYNVPDAETRQALINADRTLKRARARLARARRQSRG